jgi:hypothetical protein
MNEERLYINGNEIDLGNGAPIAKTLQVNDIGSLADRQANFTRTINIPKNPINITALDNLGIVGNASNIPYQKNTANYFFGNDCLIYNGWANVTESNDTYKVTIQDGIVDFYKAIENDYITQVGISSLNHTKTLNNIIGSWSGGTDYRYMIADYNGKMMYTPTGTTDTILNADYLIPAANVKYIWDRIFDFYGFTYSGVTFGTGNFTNLWMTYPKPTPTLVPHKIPINTQHCYPIEYTVHYFDGTAYLERQQHVVSILRDNFTNPYVIVTGCGFTTTTTYGDIVPNSTWIDVLQNGSYSIDCQCTYTDMTYFVKDAANAIVETGVLQLSSSGTTVGKVITCMAGYKIYVYNSASTDFSAEFDFTISRVDGFEVDFEQVFVDFKVTDFINEILQRFSLTMFPDKYTNNIDFLTTEEWLNTKNVIDWSDKFQRPINTTYALSNYCQNNRFKYKYNDDNANYNDGIITINNVNLPDERVVIQSRIYTPEKEFVPMLDFQTHVYKFWNKEVKDDSTINYKPLDNRFYLMRSNDHNFIGDVTIGSETLNLTATTNSCKIESYSRLRFQDIITDYYTATQAILNTSKIQTVELYLTPKDINEFDFRKLVYLEQFGSYFVVNKISNYIPLTKTKVELIEVDYEPVVSSYIPIEPETNTATFIHIDSVTVSGCSVVLTYSTDATLETEITVIAKPNDFGIPMFEPVDPMYYYEATTTNSGATGNTISFTLEAGTYYEVQLSILGLGTTTIYSNEEYFENAVSCPIESPESINISDIKLISGDTFTNQYQVTFSTDAVLPRTVYYADYKTPVGFFGGWSTYNGVPNVGSSPINVLVSTLFGTPLEIRLKIGNTVSNEYTI